MTLDLPTATRFLKRCLIGSLGVVGFSLWLWRDLWTGRL